MGDSSTGEKEIMTDNEEEEKDKTVAEEEEKKELDGNDWAVEVERDRCRFAGQQLFTTISVGGLAFLFGLFFEGYIILHAVTVFPKIIASV